MNHAFFEKLTNLCHGLLYEDKKLFKYLKERNISPLTIKRYKLGAFPKDLRILFDDMSAEELRSHEIVWNASESPFSMSVSPAKGSKKIRYPVVIPIHNADGKPVAIGCRTLIGEDKRKELGIPKYRNSRYEKTAYLFGLDKAIKAIREKDRVFVVEGYFDVIACHQAGIYNVVATCGTLFSWRQLVILSRYTNNVVLLFDNDAPGHTSSRRVMDKLSNNDLIKVNLTYRFTPNGYKDIDEYLCRGGDLNFFTEE